MFKAKRGLLCAYIGQLPQQVDDSSSLLPLLAACRAVRGKGEGRGVSRARRRRHTRAAHVMNKGHKQVLYLLKTLNSRLIYCTINQSIHLPVSNKMGKSGGIKKKRMA